MGVPGPSRLADASVDEISALGMPGARARTIRELSRTIAREELRLSSDVDPGAAIERMLSIPG